MPLVREETMEIGSILAAFSLTARCNLLERRQLHDDQLGSIGDIWLATPG
jgi:hypothetical protein